jgi:putative DNA methylase
LKRLNLENYNGYTSAHAPMEESLYAGKLSSTPTGNVKAFAEGLASVFTESRRILADDGLVVFSYSHNEISAWIALSYALTRAGFSVTNVFPVRSEGESQFHSSQGNLKWDAVFCCRPWKKVCPKAKSGALSAYRYNDLDTVSLKRWRQELRAAKLGFSKADARSLALGFHTKTLCNALHDSPESRDFEIWLRGTEPTFVAIEEKSKKL